MTQWEYKIINLPIISEAKNSHLEIINRMGMEGWEMTGIFFDTTYYRVWFKRTLDNVSGVPYR